MCFTMKHMFQSYLYGIEMKYRTQRNCKRLSFNRTFMELKLQHNNSEKSLFKFQSYLYGIEIGRVWGHKIPLAKVSIVPLWN